MSLADEFEGMIVELRRVQDAVSSTRPSLEAVQAARALISEAADRLEPFEIDEAGQMFGKGEVAGRSQALVPVIRDLAYGDGTVSATVSFSRFYLGGGAAAHGGTLPLVFDELLGRLAGHVAPVPLRTAFLKVDYRAITPLDTDVRLTGAMERHEGRKMFIRGEMRLGDKLLAEAESLFLTLLPGQP